MKTAHGFSGGRHRVKFGANARHISDLGDPDANYFCLLGGQDGWIGSANFIDQLDLWRSGRHIRVPLMPETVRREFRHVTELSPG
jgi:penicillin G amidase